MPNTCCKPAYGGHFGLLHELCPCHHPFSRFFNDAEKSLNISVFSFQRNTLKIHKDVPVSLVCHKCKIPELKRLTLEAFSYIFRQTAPYSIRVLKPVKTQELLFNFKPQSGKGCKGRIYTHELTI